MQLKWDPAKVVLIGEVWGPSNNPKGSVASSVSKCCMEKV